MSNKAKAGETIEVYGDIDTQKDFLYVKDLALAVKNALESEEASGFYNIGYDENFRLIDIAKTIIDVFSLTDHKSELIHKTEISNNGGFPLMDTTKLKKEIGFIPIFGEIHSIIEDYKMELDRGLYTNLFGE